MTERYEVNRVLWDGSQGALDRFEALGASFLYARTYFIRSTDRGEYVSLSVVGADDVTFNVPIGAWVVLTAAGYWELAAHAPSQQG